MFNLKQRKIQKLKKKIQLLKAQRQTEQAASAALKKEIGLYLQLAAVYETLKGKKTFPYADISALECFRAAASLDDPAANYWVGNKLLAEAKYRDALQKEGIIDSDNNQSKIDMTYKEALAYLENADKLSHVEAKRLRGLCYINGWGVAIDENAGFELVVQSIEQEGSWDRVPQIFEAIGLNKPEFFAAIMQRKKTL